MMTYVVTHPQSRMIHVPYLLTDANSAPEEIIPCERTREMKEEKKRKDTNSLHGLEAGSCMSQSAMFSRIPRLL